MATSVDSNNSPRPKPNPLQWDENTNLYIPYSDSRNDKRGSLSISESKQAGYQRKSSIRRDKSKICLIASATLVGLSLIGLGGYSASTYEKGSHEYNSFVTVAACGGAIITSLCIAAICKRFWC